MRLIVAITAACLVTAIAGRGVEAGDRATAALLAGQLAVDAEHVLDRHAADEDAGIRRAALIVADTLLAHAVELDGGAAEWVLRRAHIAGAMGDHAAERDAIAAYLKLEPADDAMQWRLVQLMLDEAGTAERRLEMLDRLADGPGSERLSSAMRSRAALHAAALHVRRGNEAAYGERLARAVDLDETNKAAALEALSLLIERNAPLIDRMHALMGALAADPADSSTHALIGTTLLNCGAPDVATAWLASAVDLARANGTTDVAEAVAPQLAKAQKLQTQDAAPTPRTPGCDDAVRIAEQAPASLRRLTQAGSRMLDLHVEPARGSVQWGEPLRARLTVTNTSGMPLGMHGQIVAPRVLLVVTIGATANGDTRRVDQRVVDMGRRLRLAPGERVSADVTIDCGWFEEAGKDVETLSGVETLEIRAMLNPVVDRQGVVGSAAVGHTTASSRIKVDAGALTDEATASLVGVAMAGRGTASLRAAGRLVWAQGDEDPRVAAAVRMAYTSSDSMGRAWLTSVAARRRPRGQIAQQAWGDSEPIVRVAALGALVCADPEPGVVEDLSAEPDTGVRRLAEAVRTLVERSQKK